MHYTQSTCFAFSIMRLVVVTPVGFEAFSEQNFFRTQNPLVMAESH